MEISINSGTLKTITERNCILRFKYLNEISTYDLLFDSLNFQWGYAQLTNMGHDKIIYVLMIPHKCKNTIYQYWRCANDQL